MDRQPPSRRSAPPDEGDQPQEQATSSGWYGVPSLTGQYASRPRLTAMLDETETVPLVLLSAPAGTGKTSLVADWVRHSGELDRTAWVTSS